MAYGGWKWWQVQQFEPNRGQAIAEDMVGPPLTEFELTERSGKPFRTADMSGKVWVATYFFTTCPGELHSAESEYPGHAQHAGA